jgi:PKD repeat protein
MFLTLLLIPHITLAQVYISEVAWMGSDDNANAEWIELYNAGASAVDLAGWSLRATDGSPSISLEGNISAGGYALLERTSDETVPSVHAAVIYSGAMGNTGELLELKNAAGTVVDSVGNVDGWIGGSNTLPKETLQRSGNPPTGSWITAPPTPGAGTTQGEDTQPPAVQGTGGSTSGGGSGGGSTGGSTVLRPRTTLHTVQVDVEISCDTVAVRGVPFACEADVVKGGKTHRSPKRVFWNMGDGVTYTGRSVTHTYAHAGTYVQHVTAEYGDDEYVLTEAITVEPESVRVSEVTSSYIALASVLGDMQDISGMIAVMDGAHYVFPEGTWLPADGQVRFLHKHTGLREGSVSVVDASGALLSQHKTETHSSAVPAVAPSHTTVASGAVSRARVSSNSAAAASNAVIANVLSATEHALAATSVVPSIVPSIDGTIDGTTAPTPIPASFWWSVFGLILLIALAGIAVFLMRREEDEVIAGFTIETDPDTEAGAGSSPRW